MKTIDQVIHEVTEARAAEMNADERMYFPEDLAARVAWFDTPGDPLSFVRQCVEADRAQHADTITSLPAVPTVVICDGEAFHGEDVDVIDLDFMGQAGAGSRSEMDQDDIDAVVERLRAAGFDSAADDVIEWWTA